jgi:O-antigen/teichoic acid export membrane protein
MSGQTMVGSQPQTGRHVQERLYAALRSHALAKILTQAISWAGMVFVVRSLQSSDFGLYGVAAAVLGYASMIYDGSLTESLVRRPPARGAESQAVLTLVLAISGAVTCLLIVTAGPVAAAVNEPAIAPLITAMAVGLPVIGIGLQSQAHLMRSMRFARLALISSVQALGATALTVWLAWRGAGAWALVAGFLAGVTIRAALLLHAVPIDPRPAATIRPAVGHLRFGGVLFADNVLWRTYTSFDLFLLARWTGAGATGFYALGKELANMPVEKISTVVNDVSLPAYAELARNGSEAARLLTETLRMHAVVAFPVFWGMAAVADVAVPVVFGERWTPAVFALVALSLVAPLRLLGSIETPALTGVGQPWVLVRSKLLIVPIMLGAIAAGAWFGGIDGAALAWLGGFPIAFGAGFTLVLRALGLGWRDVFRVARGAAMAAALMATLVTLAARSLDTEPEASSLVLLVLLGGVAYPALLRYLDPTTFSLVRARTGRMLGRQPPP